MIRKIMACIVSMFMSISGTAGNNINETIDNSEQYEKLWVAVILDNEQAFIEAMNSGADINRFEYHNNGTISPIIEACNNRNSERMIKKMLEYDADPDLVDISGSTVFYESINESDYVFNKLLTLNPDVNFVDKKGFNSIDCVIMSKSIDVFKNRLTLLIEEGANVTEENINRAVTQIENFVGGDTVRKIAYIWALKQLMDNYSGSNVDEDLYASYKGSFNSENKCTNDAVLYGVAGYCDKEVLKKCINEKTDKDFLLRVAIMSGNIENVKYLLDCGADLRFIGEKSYMNGLRYAVRYNNIEMVKYLLTVNSEDIDECLFISAENKNMDIIKLLVENGADINNKKAFEAVLKDNQKDIIEYFLNNGFNVNEKDSLFNERYYVRAFNHCDLETINMIANKSVKLNSEELVYAVHNSILQGNLDLLIYLKGLGADVNKSKVYEDNSESELPIYIAVGKGYLDIVKFLVENGANINSYNNEKKEAFVKSARNSEDIYEYLLECNVIS